MRLRELEARFLKVRDGGGSSAGYYLEEVDELQGADGIQFLCPKCFVANKGRIGTHSVICWFLHVPMNVSPGPGRWCPRGSSLDDITFVPSPGKTESVALLTGCLWHGFVKNGDAT